MNKIEYDKDIDLVNIEIFGRTGTDNPSEKRYRCTICKQLVCVDDCFSNKGHKLICHRCVYLKFDGRYTDVFKWQNRIRQRNCSFRKYKKLVNASMAGINSDGFTTLCSNATWK